MDKTNGTETGGSVIPPKQEVVATPTQGEHKVTADEAEKARLIEIANNYKAAYLKEKSKKKENFEGESAEDKIRRITLETLEESNLADTNRKLEEAQAREKELQLALLNKSTIAPAAMGVHSEGTPVTDTLVTPEQLADFKKRGWSDKDIERYKKNFQRQIR